MVTPGVQGGWLFFHLFATPVSKSPLASCSFALPPPFLCSLFLAPDKTVTRPEEGKQEGKEGKQKEEEEEESQKSRSKSRSKRTRTKDRQHCGQHGPTHGLAQPLSCALLASSLCQSLSSFCIPPLILWMPLSGLRKSRGGNVGSDKRGRDETDKETGKADVPAFLPRGMLEAAGAPGGQRPDISAPDSSPRQSDRLGACDAEPAAGQEQDGLLKQGACLSCQTLSPCASLLASLSCVMVVCLHSHVSHAASLPLARQSVIEARRRTGGGKLVTSTSSISSTSSLPTSLSPPVAAACRSLSRLASLRCGCRSALLARSVREAWVL